MDEVAYWRVKHSGGTITNDITEELLISKFGKNYITYIKNCTDNKGFVDVPVGGEKSSSLFRLPSLIINNASTVHYQQDYNQDFCVPKALVSMLHYMNLINEAEQLHKLFCIDQDCFIDGVANLKDVSHKAIDVLSTSLQCHKITRNSKFNWETDIQKNDMIIAVLEGSDGQVNHAVGICNSYIFDANEESAIPLCKEGLDYCVSSPVEKLQFIRFARGFYFRETRTIKRRRCFL